MIRKDFSVRKDFSRFKYNKFNPSVNEWLNSIYNFDRNKLNTFWSNKIIFDLIDSYFNIKPKKVIFFQKVKKNFTLPLKRIFVSLPEIKNSLSNNNIFIYVFNKEKVILNTKITNLQKMYKKSLYKNLTKNSLKRLKNMYNNRLTRYLKVNNLKRLQKSFKIKLYKKSIKNSRLFGLDKIQKTFIKLHRNSLNNSIFFSLKNIQIFKNKLFSNFIINSRLFKSLNISLFNNINNLNKLNLNVFNLYKICINSLKSFNFNINKKIIKSLHAKIYMNFFNKEIENEISNFIIYKRKFKNNLINDIFMEQDFTKIDQIINKKYYILFFYKRYITRLYFNNLKFNNINLLNLNKILFKLYNKHININVINLKYLHFDNSLFINAIVRKLKRRKSKVLRVLRKALILPKIPRIDPVFLLKKDLLPQIPGKNFDLNDHLIKYGEYLDLKNINKVIFESLKNIHLIGVRLEGKGRLTRRLTASRAVYKKAYKGNLKNIYSSFKNLSAVMSKGFNRSNVNYINLNSYNRNGSYGIKGWQNTM